ncbi:MAG: response regulator [Candidatus Synoicihabitans palmerolidicus]|nr:response regulator [Candidatus Synoicihabitans palmerolidicus]
MVGALTAGSATRKVPVHPCIADHRAFSQEFPLKILVTEDNRVNLKLIQQVLARYGYSPQVVENGRQCLQALRETPLDLVLMDCQMPIVDGYEATAQIRRGDAGQDRRDLSIVALTAAAMSGDREKCIAAGMNDYLSKSIRPPALLTVLKGIQSQKR